MRTIRFRGKDALTGAWVYGYYAVLHIARKDNHDTLLGYDEVSSIFNDEPGNRSNGGYWYSVKSETVGQFTGLFGDDAFGTKFGEEPIYEGDIVIPSDMADENPPRVVVFYEGLFGLATFKQYEDLQRGSHPFFNDYAHLPLLGDYFMQPPLKVIGNIYDSPELLKK